MFYTSCVLYKPWFESLDFQREYHCHKKNLGHTEIEFVCTEINSNQTIFNLADIRSSKELYKIKDSYSQTEWEQRNYIRQKSVLVIAKSFYFREWQGSILSDYLTSADHVIPDWSKIPFLRELKLLGLVTEGLAYDSILGLLFFWKIPPFWSDSRCNWEMWTSFKVLVLHPATALRFSQFLLILYVVSTGHHVGFIFFKLTPLFFPFLTL